MLKGRCVTSMDTALDKRTGRLYAYFEFVQLSKEEQRRLKEYLVCWDCKIKVTTVKPGKDGKPGHYRSYSKD